MLFNSFGYLFLFLPVAVIATALLKQFAGARMAQVGVLAASVLFYGWHRPANLLYLAASVLANWLLARQIDQAVQPGKKRWLQLGLLLNIAYLCTFKYVNFLLGTLPFLHGHEHLVPDLEFPLGISFFTLAQIMYLVDSYEGLVEAGSLFDHATFVSFFPYVISGPLARAKRMRHQFGHFGGEPGQRQEHIARGLFLFSMGLFKKAVCADTFAQLANYGFDSATRRSCVEVVIFSLTYALQLYFDFSGYSDMAIGTAEMLGVEIPRNFDVPLRSKSIIEFWTRWHISLSGFITTYLYTPIVRSFRKATLPVAMFSTLLAMTVAGLWHGPSWTFVCFGVLHGLALALNTFWRKRLKLKLPGWLGWLLTLGFVNLAFIFFRSATVPAAMAMLRELFLPEHLLGMNNLTAMRQDFSWPIFGPPVVFGVLAAFLGKSSEQLAREFKPGVRTALLSGVAMVVAAIYMNSQIAATFVYFRF